MQQNNPLVSIIVTTKNEGKNIEACLESIKAQTYAEIELIVIDNFSADQTLGIARKYTTNVYQKGPERSTQRNYGMLEKSTGEYLMYLDADMTLSPSLVNACVKFIREKECDALHISEIVTGINYWSKVRRFERSFYDGTVIDGARFFTKEIFISINGFDENITGPEDWDIDKKIKQIGKICLLPNENLQNVIFHNEAEFDMKKYLSKKSYYSKSFETYIDKWGKTDGDIKKQFGLYYRYIGVFTENGKWKKLILNPHLTIGMFILRILVGLAFIKNKPA